MNEQLKYRAEKLYAQPELLKLMLELASEERWFDLQHIIQHDLAKAILADYSYDLGKDYLDLQLYYAHWEEVIEIGWYVFCQHTGIQKETVLTHLKHLQQ